MPLSLTSFETTSPGFIAAYNVTHSTPGRDGTTLEHSLVLRADGDRFSCTIQIDECLGGTPDEALDRMATWLRRLAEGIETRKPSTAIPLG